MGESEMVEWVAKALCMAERGGYHAYREDREREYYWQQSLKKARAAIEAMREPTSDMEFDGMFKPFPGESPRLSSDEVRETWHAMIDAALPTPPDTPSSPERDQ